MTPTQAVCLLLAAGALLAAALHDLAVRTVPNTVVAVVALAGAALALDSGRLLPSAAVAAALLLAGALLWLRGYLGGADVKLLAASGLLVPPSGALPLLLGTVLAGGVLCLPYLPGRRLFARPAARRPAGLLGRIARTERWRLRRHGPLPYAVAIAGGTIFAFLQGA